ncbi:MAG: hypothetical protein RMM98_15675 [Acidobacteriota bacterium]|nr:hypothetical protein [Blastocatellia bacterium]MDW8241044.1 hypothetical protein [Acidobacteriota bacterium]
MVHTLPLQFRDGHLFVELVGELWLLDTGAPTSFGASRSITIAGEQFSLGSSYLGLTSETLSQFVGVPCVGLLGADVLGRFDHIFDTTAGSLTVSTAELSHIGLTVRLDEFMGIPIITARVGGRNCRMFFDTGAQISYFQGDSLTEFPYAGCVTDFYPGVGQFQTDTHEVPVSLGGVSFVLRCGMLPGLLGMTLMMAGTEGIIGNAILSNRTVGYFPRRRSMIL